MSPKLQPRDLQPLNRIPSNYNRLQSPPGSYQFRSMPSYLLTSLFLSRYTSVLLIDPVTLVILNLLCLKFLDLLLNCVLCYAQLYPTLSNPMDYNPPDSSVHGIIQARILEWVAISFCRGSCQPRHRTCISGLFYINRWILTTESPNMGAIQISYFFSHMLIFSLPNYHVIYFLLSNLYLIFIFSVRLFPTTLLNLPTLV